ncbi:MAG: HesA/MoeB/ThiF family protein [Desulfobacteraceae bacterium]|nr:HesA/MoeB/ThiF family protein [Desulfobacteraceae bacterium]
MSQEDLRYARQIVLPRIGKQGQALLAEKTVFLAGAGGLGSILCLYLAAAGIGKILLADHDAVDITNLNRQILFGNASLGQPKVLSAKDRLKDLNPSVGVTPIQEEVTAGNIDALIKGADVILDGTDNYAARKILNRASLSHGLPFIFGGVKGFDGMVSVFIPGTTACFECIFLPPTSKEDQKPGIIGPAAGIAASIQAMEAIKLLLNIGQSLENRLVRISGLSMSVSTTTLTSNSNCPACGAK